MALEDFHKKIDTLAQFDIELEVMNILRDNYQRLLDMIKTQMLSGKDGYDRDVTIFGKDFYSDSWAWVKERHGVGIGKETDRITNFFQGYFYSYLQLNVEVKEFFFTSDVPYFDEIMLRSGKDILRLNKANLEIVTNEIIVPELQKRFAAKWNK